MRWRGWMRESVGPSRTVLAVVLALVGALSITLAVVQWWVHHAIFDEDRFAGIAVDVVGREDVRGELRRAIVNEIILQQPDLVATRPLIETVVDTVLVSPAVRPIIEQGARELHFLLFESDRRSLVFNVSDVIALATAGVRAYDPDLAERIPGGAGIGNITIAERNAATRLVEIDRNLSALRWVFVVTAALSLAGALVVSSNRYQVLLCAGIGLVAFAIVVWLAIGVGAGLLRGSIQGNPLAAEAAVAIWNRYAQGLVWWMWIQALLGVSLATVASSAVSTVSIGDRAQHAFAFVEAWWERRAVRVGLAALIALLGIALMVAPLSTVRVIAQGAGLVLLYAGGYEMVRALGLARGRMRRPEPAPTPAAPPFGLMAPAALAGVVLLVGALATVAVFWVNRDSLSAPPASATPPIERCNGMEELCDRRLDQVVFAGTHNSMSAADERGWYFSSHTRGIPDQMHDGIRLFLIDLYYGYATNNGVRTDPALVDIPGRIEAGLGPAAAAAANNLINQIGPIPPNARPSIYLCHSYCELGATSFDRILVDMRQFLDDHPHEVLVLFLQDYVDPFDVADAFQRTGAFDYLYTLTAGEPLPTLREIIEVDRRILILSENVGDADAPPWYHDGFALTQETPYEFRAVDQLACSPNRGADDAPLFLLNHWISKLAPSPGDARVLNDFDFLYARAAECAAERGLVPNFIAVNFYELGDLFEVVDRLNREQAGE